MRAPASAAPIAALIAECSDSTLTISRVRPAVRDELREALDDRRLRRDRVDRDDVRVDLPHRLGDGLAAGQQLRPAPGQSLIGHHRRSRSVGQTSAQISQPLQWSRSKPANVVPSSSDRRVGAVEPAEQAVHARREVDLGLERRCASRRSSGCSASSRTTTPPGRSSFQGFSSGIVASSATRCPPRAQPSRPGRPSCRAARRPRPDQVSSGGSPSAAASAPSMTRFDRALRGGERRGRDAAPRPASSLGREFGVQEDARPGSRPSRRRRPRATSDGSSTTTDVRLLDRVVAPDRPVVERACTRASARRGARARTRGTPGRSCPRAAARRASSCDGGLRALPGARMPADLLHAVHRRSPSIAAGGALAVAHGLDDASRRR